MRRAAIALAAIGATVLAAAASRAQPSRADAWGASVEEALDTTQSPQPARPEKSAPPPRQPTATAPAAAGPPRTATPSAAPAPPEPVAPAGAPVRPALSPKADAVIRRIEPVAPLRATPPAQPSLAVGRFPPPVNAPDTRSAVERFCTNIADAAADARFVAQKRELERLAGELDARLARLEEKTTEYRKWLARRDEFAGKVREALTGMYAKMKPESAALHLAAMDEETAAALLLKLNVRQASAILNEMPAERAARLAMIVSGAAGAEPVKPATQAAPSDAAPQAAPDSQRGRT